MRDQNPRKRILILRTTERLIWNPETQRPRSGRLQGVSRDQNPR